jgi:integrase
VLLALTTGMRRGEILALRWKNVSDNSGTVHVAESLEQTKAGLRFKPRRAAGRAPSPSPPSRSRNCAGLNASRPSNY